MKCSYRIIIYLAICIKFTIGGLTRRTPEIQASYSKQYFNNTPIFIKRTNAIILPNSEHEDHQSLMRFSQEDAMVFPESEPKDPLASVRDENQEYFTEAPFIEEEVPNYPINQIRRLLGQNPLFKQYFAVPQNVPEIANRNKIDDELLDLCEIRTRISLPKKLKNANDEEVLVVNDDQNGYLQVVEYKECGKNTNCKYDMFGYSSRCVQKYESRRLMVYSNSTDKLLFDQFKVPSCCVCMIKRVDI